MNTWIMIVRDRVDQTWSVVPAMFASGDACEREFNIRDKYPHCDSARWHDMGWSIRNFHGDPEPGNIIRINDKGAARVLGGKAGMTFEVVKVTDGTFGKLAHVRDLRYSVESGYQSWSIARDGYDVVGLGGVM
jgi:hypothetical protein